jgi:ornithine carbamoyltransferase
MRRLPAFNFPGITVGPDITEQMTGGPEVADETFGPTASIVSDRAGNRLHISTAILVAAYGR